MPNGTMPFASSTARWTPAGSSTTSSRSSLFDTVYIVDEDGRAILAIGAASRSPSRYPEAFGPSLASMIAELPNDGMTYDVEDRHRPGRRRGSSIAVGPVVPVSTNLPDARRRGPGIW